MRMYIYFKSGMRRLLKKPVTVSLIIFTICMMIYHKEIAKTAIENQLVFNVCRLVPPARPANRSEQVLPSISTTSTSKTTDKVRLK